MIANTPKPEHKTIAIVLAFVAAAALLLCGVSRRWMAAPGHDAGYGPIGWSCDRCEGELHGWRSTGELVKTIREDTRGRNVAQPSDLFPLAGYATLLLSLIGAGALVVSAVFALRGPVPVRPVAPPAIALLALFGALITGMVFMAKNPLKGIGIDVGTAWAFWLFGAAVVTGIVAAQMLMKWKKVDPGDFLV
jgi:hypothetical protein